MEGIRADTEEYSVVDIDIDETSGIDEVRTARDVMLLSEIAFRHIYPGRRYDYQVSVTFSGKLGPYNGTISRFMNKLHFRISKKWIGITPEIFQGLLEELMIKMFGGKNKESVNVDLYNNFIKRLHLTVPKTRSHPTLEESFNRINTKYFDGIVERPNLRMGKPTRSKLGSYDYKTDMISISSIFENHEDVIDYIMYHEVLHKVLKFKQSGTKNYHHTAEFRRKEKEFENSDLMEKRIKEIIASRQRKKKTTGSTPFIRRLSSFF
ncbi:hypothetical protein COV93_05585 [Candidatus Woesearchaeota archaeon CG11_big_fil_rev_8_21_14_0_20_43_8]|nr:MAG: hypothetical protein COV93_05585 [Candidatus Woesearchaeota archaeon CG11_big_fil_rev_8_21_14_0_20_43_8]PIO04804.1 MAG: hypothetical protein COT47_07415 [Candidatus Woesearchaeota archaeon CG08_land_8_20_14_0_20_43_7]